MNTTIAAVSTPHGKGGVSLLRISGPQACEICSRVFAAQNGRPLCQQKHAHLVRGTVHDGQTTVDDGMAAIFFAPRSYTGEEVVEITCHGGVLLTQKVLSCLYAAGAEPAGPGEFTQRAFLNGKMGLSQAEAVIDLIDAETEEKLRLANAQRGGVLSRRAGELYDTVLRLISSVYAYVDFPDEDMTDYSVSDLRAQIASVADALTSLLATYRQGRAVTQGIRTVICGKPNTGKSSLLNRILGEERAIVTELAGTTRDTIEENAVIGRVMLRLCDTAGIRQTDDRIEEMGIARSVQMIGQAELILALFDPSVPFDESDRMLCRAMADNPGAMRVALLNKNDLPALWSAKEVEAMSDFSAVLSVSCETGEGIGALYDVIERAFLAGELDYDTTAVLTNERQYRAVENALSCVRRAAEALDAGLTQDVAGMDLEQALASLGELDSRAVTEEVVNDIFHRFCVGK